MTEMLRVNALAILTPSKEISDSFLGAKYEWSGPRNQDLCYLNSVFQDSYNLVEGFFFFDSNKTNKSRLILNKLIETLGI